MTISAATLHQTRNDLSSDVRGRTIDLLQARLADAVDLQTQLKQAHWNVKGPHFVALHELFDRIYDDTTGHVDEIAERLVALGGTAQGTARMVAGQSALPEYPADIFGGADHVRAVADALAAFGSGVRAAIEVSGDLGDAGTEDLFTGISRDVDKNLWFVEAHGQAGA